MLSDSPEVEQPGESACASELTDDLADTNITDVMAMEDTNAADPSNDVEDMSRASLKKKHLSSSSDDNPASKHRFQRGFTDQQVTSVDADGRWSVVSNCWWWIVVSGGLTSSLVIGEETFRCFFRSIYCNNINYV